MTDKEEAAARKAYSKFLDICPEVEGLYLVRRDGDSVTLDIHGPLVKKTRSRVWLEDGKPKAEVFFYRGESAGLQLCYSGVLQSLFIFYLEEAKT